MDSNPQRPPLSGHRVDNPDARYRSELASILVETIREAKNGISRVEFILCSQLFPHFHLSSQSFQNIGNEVRQAAADAYKGKDYNMLLQCKDFQGKVRQILMPDPLFKPDGPEFINQEMQLSELQKESKQQNPDMNGGREVLRELHNFIVSRESLIQRYEDTMKELKEKDSMLLKKLKAFEFKNEELQLLLAKKSEEFDEVMELNQSQGSTILQKEEKLRAREKKINELVIRLDDAVKKAEVLQSTLAEQTDEIEKGKEMQENLLSKIEYQASEIARTKQLSNKYEKENILLAAKAKCLSEHADELQKEVCTKINEVEKAKQLQNQLVQQIDVLDLEKIKAVGEFEEYKKEMDKLVDKKKSLEEKLDKLQECLYERNRESSEGMQLHGKLLQQIQAKNFELLSEKRKRKYVITAYKSVISRYNLPSENSNHSPMNMIPGFGTENEVVPRDDIENNAEQAVVDANEESKHGELQKAVDSKGVAFQKSNPISKRCPESLKSSPQAGRKRRHISPWRDTRTCQSRFISDPHDDFLDTPLQNLKRIMGKAIKEDNHDLPLPCPMNTNLENSDSETQDMNMNALPQKQEIRPINAESSVFKYVESTRRKCDRENLKGVECRQCSKFYDVVLPDSTMQYFGKKKGFLCEHHDGISRHRYRYAPPLTPDGFWNIGFESET